MFEDIDRLREKISYDETDPTKDYLSKLGKYDLLDREQELDLGHKIQNGLSVQAELRIIEESSEPNRLTADQDDYLRQIVKEGEIAKDLMIKSNLRLVVFIAKNYIHKGIDLLELIQEGNIGLNTAANKFDANLGWRFSTYASWWIKQHIGRFLSTNEKPFRLPGEQANKLMAFNKLESELKQNPDGATKDGLREYGFEPEEVDKMRLLGKSAISLDAKTGETDNDLYSLIAYEQEELGSSFDMDYLEDIFSRAGLTDEERSFLTDKFGLGSREPKTLKQIAENNGRSLEQVRQVQMRSLHKLRMLMLEDKELAEAGGIFISENERKRILGMDLSPRKSFNRSY